MKNKILHSAIILLSAVLFSCQTTPVQPPPEPISFTDAAVTLYEDSLTDGVYTKFSLNTATAAVDFTGAMSSSREPELILRDLTGDGLDDCAVLLISSGGTGVRLENARVFDGASLTEYPVRDPLDYINEQVTFASEVENFIIQINGSDVRIAKDGLDTPDERLFDEIACGAWVEYDVIGGELVCQVGCSVSPSDIHGCLNVKYAFAEGEFVPQSVEYMEE